MKLPIPMESGRAFGMRPATLDCQFRARAPAANACQYFVSKLPDLYLLRHHNRADLTAPAASH